jgi:predicted O-methyltransferase YrrM
MGFFHPRVLMQLLTKKPYGIHSPFLYDFAKNCLYADVNRPEFEKLEDLRNEYKKSKEKIQVSDFGAGAARQAGRQQGQAASYGKMVGLIARRALQKPRYCRLFHRMARYLNPTSVLELGSSLGISTCYLAMGAPRARVITLEGCPETASLARQTFGRAGLSHIELVNGPFKSTLPGLLKTGFSPDLVYIDGDHTYEGLKENFFLLYEHIRPGGVVIIDDIRWSRGMWKAWKEIILVREVRLSLDIGPLGILFFDKRLSKENITMGY